VLIDGPTVSLNNLTARLRQIRDAFNNAASAATDFRWQASLQGARLVLTPTAGDANSRATAFSTGAVFDLGGANAGLDVGANRNNTRYYSLDNNALGEYQTTAGNNGSDGNTPTPANYDAAYLVLDSQVDLFNLLILPRASAQNDNAIANLWGAASAFCQRRRAFLLVDPPRDSGTGWSSIADVSSTIANFRIGVATDYAAVYWPQVLIPAGAITQSNGQPAVWVVRRASTEQAGTVELKQGKSGVHVGFLDSGKHTICTLQQSGGVSLELKGDSHRSLQHPHQLAGPQPVSGDVCNIDQ